jgi:hypothetical protein
MKIYRDTMPTAIYKQLSTSDVVSLVKRHNIMCNHKIKLRYILTLILTICSSSFGQAKSEMKNQEQKTIIYTVDSSVVAILPFDSTLYNWVFKNKRPTDLSTKDLQNIESILNKCINDYNPHLERYFNELKEKHPNRKINKKNFTIDLANYRRQYLPAINSKGEKEVWVNCFCDKRTPNWRNEVVFVNDGGNCYFNLKINLTTGKYYELRVNGDA